MSKTWDGLYNEKMCERILALAKKCDNNEEIAFLAGISYRTLYNWQKKYPELKASIKEAKTLADDAVELSFHKRATGYSHKAVKIFYDKDLGKVIEHEYLEHIPPDTNAGKFWLTNRRPEAWTEKSTIAHEVTDKMTDAELKEAIRVKLEAREGK